MNGSTGDKVVEEDGRNESTAQPQQPPPTVRVISCGDLNTIDDVTDARRPSTQTEEEGSRNVNKLYTVLQKVSNLHTSPKAGPFHALLLVCSEYKLDSGESAWLSGDCIDKAMRKLYETFTSNASGRSMLPPIFIFNASVKLLDEVEMMTSVTSQWAANEKLEVLTGAGVVYIGKDSYYIHHREASASFKETEELHKRMLKVCYCCGTFNPMSYDDTSGGVMAAVAAERSGEMTKRSVDGLINENRPRSVNDVTDILITPEWPAGVSHGSSAAPLGTSMSSQGCVPSALLAASLQPRYHIASSLRTFYQRDAYINPHGHLTRFIGLAGVGGKEKVSTFRFIILF